MARISFSSDAAQPLSAGRTVISISLDRAAHGAEDRFLDRHFENLRDFMDTRYLPGAVIRTHSFKMYGTRRGTPERGPVPLSLSISLYMNGSNSDSSKYGYKRRRDRTRC